MNKNQRKNGETRNKHSTSAHKKGVGRRGGEEDENDFNSKAEN